MGKLKTKSKTIWSIQRDFKLQASCQVSPNISRAQFRSQSPVPSDSSSSSKTSPPRTRVVFADYVTSSNGVRSSNHNRNRVIRQNHPSASTHSPCATNDDFLDDSKARASVSTGTTGSCPPIPELNQGSQSTSRQRGTPTQPLGRKRTKCADPKPVSDSGKEEEALPVKRQYLTRSKASKIEAQPSSGKPGKSKDLVLLHSSSDDTAPSLMM
ncbi:hypothetical protein D5086_024655 [Populus alba]|uniref:Uncharacterized protein n=1 Tax=Populus alba TaxID=43335 RepID=A0ACC4B7N0_POPAL